jgi:hypothetical protein
MSNGVWLHSFKCSLNSRLLIDLHCLCRWLPRHRLPHNQCGRTTWPQSVKPLLKCLFLSAWSQIMKHSNYNMKWSSMLKLEINKSEISNHHKNNWIFNSWLFIRSLHNTAQCDKIFKWISIETWEEINNKTFMQSDLLKKNIETKIKRMV